VLLPTFLQQLQGYTPAQAGVLMASRGISSIFAMFISGKLVTLIQPKRTLLIGIGTVTASMWMMAGFDIDTPASQFIVVGLIQGIGIPLAFMPITFVAFATLPDSSRTEAGVLLTLIRNIGGSAGISVAIALLSRSAQVNMSYLAEFFTPYSSDRWQAVGSQPGANAATGGLMGEIGKQALAIAYSNDFHVLAAATLLSVPFVLLLRSPRRPAIVKDAASSAVADAAH
jgi:DHA2 family multidrug resistance protein